MKTLITMVALALALSSCDKNNEACYYLITSIKTPYSYQTSSGYWVTYYKTTYDSSLVCGVSEDEAKQMAAQMGSSVSVKKK